MDPQKVKESAADSLSPPSPEIPPNVVVSVEAELQVPKALRQTPKVAAESIACGCSLLVKAEQLQEAAIELINIASILATVTPSLERCGQLAEESHKLLKEAWDTGNTLLKTGQGFFIDSCDMIKTANKSIAAATLTVNACTNSHATHSYAIECACASNALSETTPDLLKSASDSIIDAKSEKRTSEALLRTLQAAHLT